MKDILFRFIIFSFLFSGSLSAQTIYNIEDYGARGDSATINTIAIQQAIDAASDHGGGVVIIPPGTFISGTIRLKSYVTLRLENGAMLLGSPNLSDYPELTPAINSRVNLYCKRSLIYAEDLDHIAIEGDGTIHGNGGSFPRKAAYHLRPFIIRVVSCRNVRVEGVLLTSSPMWTHHYLNCDHVRINGIKVWGFSNANNDGIDIDGCRDVIISNSNFSTSDDGITLKSTSDHPTQGIVITNCIVRSRSSAIKFGTDSSWGFKDITISNCTVLKVPLNEPFIFGQDRKIGYVGIELIIVDGGDMERVAVDNISIQGYLVPFGVRLGDRGKGYVPEDTEKSKTTGSRPTGTIKDISFSNIVASEGGRNVGILLLGHTGHPIKNISLSNITIRNEGGGEAELTNRVVEEKAREYPQFAWWGDLPAYGLYGRHLEGLKLSNIRLETIHPDQRHALVLDDVEDADLDGISTSPGTEANALIRISQSSKILIRGCNPQSPRGAYLKVDGENSSGITLLGNDLSKVKKPIELSEEVIPGEVHQAGNFDPE
jgi:hypothetical protein